MYKGMTGIVLYKLLIDIPCRMKHTPMVSLTLFSSLSSFQGTCCTCGVAGHPGGGATDYYASPQRIKSQDPALLSSRMVFTLESCALRTTKE